MVELYLHSPICLHGLTLNSLSTWTTFCYLLSSFYCNFTEKRKKIDMRLEHESIAISGFSVIAVSWKA
jgi:hypothetical protein